MLLLLIWRWAARFASTGSTVRPASEADEVRRDEWPRLRRSKVQFPCRRTPTRGVRTLRAKLPGQDLGTHPIQRRRHDATVSRDHPSGVTFGEPAGRFEVDRSTRDVQVDVRRVRQRDAGAGLQAGAPKRGGLLLNLNRAVVAAPRSDREQLARIEQIGDVGL